MEQLTKNQAVATSQEAVQNQNEPQLRDENAHNEDRKSGSAGMPRPISYAVFCLKKKTRRLPRARRDPGAAGPRRAPSRARSARGGRRARRGDSPREPREQRR